VKNKKGSKMSQRLTLARYLQGGGEVKTLTRIEAVVFGIPYPLQPGWPRKYGAMEITDGMIEDLKARIVVAKQSTAKSAQRRLDGIGEVMAATEALQRIPLPRETASVSLRASPVPGFVLRQAKRYRARKPAPWA
jgi:hypothetical protein